MQHRERRSTARHRRNRLALALLVALLAATPLWGIGYIYTGVGGGGREVLDITSVDVSVQITDRVALTRTDQVFTNRAGNVVEGIYEFTLPVGAIITDLVLWIGDTPVQGLILEKEEGRRIYDNIVRRQVDPALVEHISGEKFRLSIFPFPAGGSRRVELEYVELLKAEGGTSRYTFPLAPESEQKLRLGRFLLEVDAAAQHPFDVEVNGVPRQITRIERPDGSRALVQFADESLEPESDFELVLRESGPANLPRVISFAPDADGADGFYALWLPPLESLAQADPLPRSLTFVIDSSSSMQGGRLDAVKDALAAAIEDLGDGDLFNIVVFSNRAAAFADEPVPATPENREAARAFVRRQSALGVTNYEESLALALGQPFPDGRSNHVLFLTDGYPTTGETDLGALSAQVKAQAGPGLRLFTVGVGDAVDQGFLRALAADHLGEASFLSDDAGIERRLRQLFTEFTRPVFLPTDLVFEGIEVEETFPRDLALLADGREFFQVGRYRRGGAFTLKLVGRIQDREEVFEYPLAVEEATADRPIIPRLWAHQKVQALEAQIARFGPQPELLDGILQLGLAYRLVTRRTSLFAPDESVVVNPAVARDESCGACGGGATAVEEEASSALTLLDRPFRLLDGVWTDTAFRPGMPIVEYDGGNGPPALAEFAALGRDLLVVEGDTAYRLRPGLLPAVPLLRQNAPNPFNAGTSISFVLPGDGVPVRLSIYNLAGQRIRTLQPAGLTAGENRLLWDGLDQQGRQAASGAYIYRLEGSGFAVSRRMLLLR